MSRSARATGKFYEDKVCQFYENLGFNVWAVPPTKWGRGGKYRSTDIFNTFDVIASSKDRVVLAQVKKEGALVLRKKVIQSIKDIAVPVGVDKEYWVFNEKGEAFVMCISGDKIIKGKRNI